MASIDISGKENELADFNFNALENPHKECEKLGFKMAIVAVPEDLLYSVTDQMLDLDFYKRILVE